MTGNYPPDWRTYYTTDALGSVTGSFRFDESNTLVATTRNVYTAYGEATRSGPDAAFDGPLYAGYFFDAQTGLYQVRNRYYDPSLSNFISRDPIAYDAGDPNLYRYVANGPIGATDPWGLAEADREGFDRFRRGNYRREFYALTPDVPNAWPIHHLKQEALRERYRELGINVDNPKYLRAVPPEIHDDINKLQQKWRKEMASQLDIRWNRFYQEVPLDEVQKFERLTEEIYAEVWVTSGRNQLKRVQSIQTKVANRGWLAKFQVGFVDRMKKVGLTKLTGFAFLTLFSADKAIAAWDARTFDPRTDSDFQNFIHNYRCAVDEILRNERLSANRAHHLRQAWHRLASRFATAETQDAVNIMDAELGKYIDTKLH